VRIVRQDGYSMGEIKVEYCPSKDMLAVMFTKALHKPRHEVKCNRIGLVDVA
jgi:hypothetical protein